MELACLEIELLMAQINSFLQQHCNWMP